MTAFDFDCPKCCTAAEVVRRLAGDQVTIVERTRTGLELPNARRTVRQRLDAAADRSDR